tara:strand:+ start:243 stop:365 length:123 start_codon:yes stop_codon:yes gene_type:complete
MLDGEEQMERLAKAQQHAERKALFWKKLFKRITCKRKKSN